MMILLNYVIGKKMSVGSSTNYVTFSRSYVFSESIENSFEESLGVRAWRLTAGRISSMLQIPFCSIFMITEISKVIIKFSFITITFDKAQNYFPEISNQSMFVRRC